jgi:hypothetical protein
MNQKTFLLILSVVMVSALLVAGVHAQSLDPSGATTSQAQMQASHLVFLPLIAKPQQEWTLHKTADNLHPDASEQQMMWLMNRARTNPTQEGIWLATSNESDIAGGRTYFGVNLSLLQSEFAGYNAAPPAAFDVRMYNAAKAHSDDLILRDAQDHDHQFDRIADAGFTCWGGRGNVFSYARSALYAHAAFNIDWGGNDGTGMQTGRGHRMAIMSVDGNYTNVGFAMVPENNPNTNVGPLVTTENFCYASEIAVNHFNRFIVGTVWRDNNNNGRYDPGEGIGNVRIAPNHGTYYVVTANSGGYAIPIESAGTYTLTFSGAVNSVTNVTVGTVSILVDLKLPVTTAPQSIEPNQNPITTFLDFTPPPGIRFPVMSDIP